MKKWLLLLMIASMYCSACKKDAVNNSGSYFIKAKLNGTEKTFSGSAYASEYAGDLSAGFNMSAKNDADSSVFSLNITHPFGAKITERIYGNLSNGYYATAGYTRDTVIFYSRIILPDASTIQITISNITNTIVTGSFSGTLLNADSTEAITIKDGSFNLPVQ
jgi:hypothetical protein